jgi:hypothetical protein
MNYKKLLIGPCLMAALAGCHHRPTDAALTDALPPIYPDYTDVTIPADIAPLDFNGAPEAEDLYVVIQGEKGGRLEVSGSPSREDSGPWADIDIEDWHRLTAQNVGADLTVTAYMRYQGRWTQYRSFPIHVSSQPLEDYGLTYRLIPPGYEVGGYIGIYQRDLHSFRQDPILTIDAVPQHCMNCHTALRADPSHFTSHIRGEKGGTLVQIDGHQRWLNTRTPESGSAGSYADWHPGGRYIAYSANVAGQHFFVGPYKPIEVYHRTSHLVVLDTQTDELLLDSLLMQPEVLPIFPAFSAKGNTLYYSVSRYCEMPLEYEKVKCSIVGMAFDAGDDTRRPRFGEQVDTLLNGERDDCSYVLVRPSYDGRWLMYTRCCRSNFPIAQRDADLWMMDLQTRRTWPLEAVNSSETESFHNWSSNSHWFVYASKVEDTMYTRLYLSSITDEGQATKPFLLPQKNPRKFYHALFDAYNVPDFTRQPVELDINEARKKFESGEREVVKAVWVK